MYSQFGLGDATCPSAEQLAGITDPSDPCQSTFQQIPLFSPVNTSTLPPAVAASGCPSGSTCTYIAGVPDNAVYVLGALVLSFILFGALSK